MARRAYSLALATVLATAVAVAPARASSGGFDRAWGYNVDQAGGTDFEICTVAASCKAGAEGGLGGQFHVPAGAATDSDGNLYVADTFNNRIQKFDSEGNFLLALGKDVVSGNAETGFETCAAAASCQAGQIGGLGGELKFPAGVVTDADDNLYVADTGNHRIQKFDPSGNFLEAWGKNVSIFGLNGFETCFAAALCQTGQTGTLGGEFVSPRGIATAGGSVYVTDTASQRIQQFDASGNFQRTWGKDVIGGNVETGFEICTSAASCKAGASGGMGGELSNPEDVATDAAGSSLYVTEGLGGNRIQKFDTSGNFHRAWGRDVDTGGGAEFEICTTAPKCQGGEPGGLGGELGFPEGVATDAAGDLYVTEGGRIQKFDAAGNFQRVWGKDVVSGNVETGFEICTAAALCQSGGAGGLGGELSVPYGAATDAAGKLYVVDSLNSRIQKFGDPAAAPPPPEPGDGVPGDAGGGAGGSTTSTTGTTTATGQRAAALKKCKKKFPKGPRRAKCLKKAKRLPV